MKKNHARNPNAPPKGSNITVEPIRRIQDIRAIIELLEASPRNKLLFVMGINNGLRIGDLLRIKVGDVRGATPGTVVPIKEEKTRKNNILVINEAVYKALEPYLKEGQLSNEDYLFKGRQGGGPIKVGMVNRLIKSWTAAINLPGRYGCASLRKTWGYIQRTVFTVGFEVIAKRFQHSSPAITMRYLGIQDQEVLDTLMNKIE